MKTPPSSTEFDLRSEQQPPPPIVPFHNPQKNLLTEAFISERKKIAPNSLKHQERYEVLQKLGEGGMGVVELVKDHYLGREVARKTLKFKMDLSKKRKKIQEIRLWRLKKEASITAVLEHPNIIPLYEMQENENTGELQFTMRKVEGETLRQIFQKAKTDQNTYNENKLLNIFHKVCDGVSYAHAQGVVHRDLKPENIMIGKFGEVYVMDWGIAKQLNLKSDIEQENTITLEKEEASFQTIGGIGTIGYMPPEQQTKAANVTFQADIYALGKILKECFTQQTPLESMQHRIDEILSKKNRNSSSQEKIKRIKKAPEEIEAIEKKATHEKLKDRYQSVQELMEDLDRYQNNLRISVKEYSLLEIFKKWVNRNKKELLLFGMVLTLFLSLILYYQWQNYRKREEQCILLQQESQNKKEKANQISSPKNKQEQEEKIQYLLESFNDIEDGLKLKPEESFFENERIHLGEYLIRETCTSQDYRLARYISERLKDSFLLTKSQKEQWRQYVTFERDHQLKNHQKILQEWLIKAKSEVSFHRLEEGEVQDFIFEVSQMKEPEIFEQLIRELNEGLAFFKENSQEFRSAKQEEYYRYIAEILGRLGNQEAAEPLLNALETLSKKIIQQEKSFTATPVGELDLMIALAQSLGNLKNQDFGLRLNSLRWEMGLNSLFSRRTERSAKKLLDGIIAHYSKQLQSDSSSATAYYHRGMAYQEKNFLNEAISDYHEAIRLNPFYADAYNNRGLIKRTFLDLDGAILDFTEAIRCNPNDAGAYMNRGSTKQKKKKFAEAIMDYNEALRINPHYPEAYNERGTANENTKNLENALLDYNEAIRLNPQYAKAYMNRGNVKQVEQDLEGAIFDYTTAIRLDPQYADAYNNRGNVKQVSLDLEGAILDYTMAIRLNPQMILAYCNRGTAKRAKQDLNGAILDYTESIRLDPQYALPYYNRGLVKTQQKDFQGGIEDWEKSLSLEPSIPIQNSLIDLLKQQIREAVGKKEWQGAKTFLLKLKKYVPLEDPQQKQIDQKLQQIDNLLSPKEEKK